jgi:arylsulfatase A-like enzyme
MVVVAMPCAAAALPNLLFILADDLGYSELSIMPRGPARNTNITTPNIDALFTSGMQFSNAYCGEAVCAPSRASLMTGRHTGHTYIRGNAPGPDGHGLPLNTSETTIFEVAKAAGYRTACIGKWGVGWWNSTGAPNAKGCDTYFGVLDQSYAHNMYPSAPDFTWRFSAGGPPQSIAYPENTNASRELCMAPGNTCTWSHELWTAEAMRALSAQADEEEAARAAGLAAPAPLFIYLAYTDPHAGGWSGTEESGNPVPSNSGPRVDFSKQGWPEPEKDHASVIANFLDADVGKLVALLESRGMRASTAVVFASDNGASNEGHHDYMFFESSGPLRGFKRCLTEGGIRTPFAWSWPGTIAAAVTDYAVAFWDLLPTLADLMGTAPPADIDGISYKNQLLGSGQQAPHPPFYWEFCTDAHPPGVANKGVGWGQAVRNGTWKGVSFFSADNKMELFDLSADPSESTNVAAAHPDIVAAFWVSGPAPHPPPLSFFRTSGALLTYPAHTARHTRRPLQKMHTLKLPCFLREIRNAGPARQHEQISRNKHNYKTIEEKQQQRTYIRALWQALKKKHYVWGRPTTGSSPSSHPALPPPLAATGCSGASRAAEVGCAGAAGPRSCAGPGTCAGSCPCAATLPRHVR